MREIFTRKQDEEVLSIEIETDAPQYKEKSPWLFSVFIKYDVIDTLSFEYENFLEIKESLIISIEYDGKAHYIGSRILDGWSEFYFCASSAKELDSLVTAMLKETGFVYESNIVKDKKWGFYETQLFPTELELAHMQSEKIIFLLEEEGEDLNLARDVEHYVSFEMPTQKERFLDTLDLEGFTFKDEISTEEFDFGVALVKNHNVTHEETAKVIDDLFLKIKEHKGYYEGWSTTLVNEEESD